MAAKVDDWGKWDKKTQTFHAGQDWSTLTNYVEDFGVTTNALGTPASGAAAALKALGGMGFYPPANFEPGLTDLAKFLWPDNWLLNKHRLLLGNGASELIDLIARCGTTVGGFKNGPFPTQYKEYERSAAACGYKILKAEDPTPATLVCIVNPCNPTGDYLHVDELKSWIEEHCADRTTVMVDESMQLWLGPHWREDSLISQARWVERLKVTRGIKVYVVHSWTKIWSCAGIRLGSFVAPTIDEYEKVKSFQVPWTVNCIALHFLSAVAKDDEYMQQTWALTTPWRAAAKKRIEEEFGWHVYGAPFTSWLWIETDSPATAREVVRLAKAAGTPVRSGSPGYDAHHFFRMAVRAPDKQAVLFAALAPLGLAHRARA
jgi:histidinol-phosphate/aromatic aminotransferase/cobyric acid decarboxylase-like protein